MEESNKNLPVTFSSHAKDSMRKRGAEMDEVLKAIQQAEWKEAKKGRFEAKLDFPYNKDWNKKRYLTKQVNPVFVMEADSIVVITVYVFYFN